MSTNYNTISREYQRSKQQPWRHFIECFTLFELTGDLTGLAVLDLACGEGYYTRQLKQRGASRVVGVDLSTDMIDLARRQEIGEPLGVDYHVGDAKQIRLVESFDLVVAGYLVNYAATREELLAMCRTIAENLKPGCRFVSVNNNPDQPRSEFPLGLKYGFIKFASEEPHDGTPITWTFYLDEGPFSITNYQLSTALHEEVFHEAGFREVHWHGPRLMPDGAVAYEPGFWADFLEHPPIIYLECLRE